MAVILEARFEKADIMNAYINEIYLGQDGQRAVHGFGLASQFYFGKPLYELELHEVALMVAIVRGPSYYDPRRHPERALERRNLVLKLLAAQGVIAVDASPSPAGRERATTRLFWTWCAVNCASTTRKKISPRRDLWSSARSTRCCRTGPSGL